MAVQGGLLTSVIAQRAEEDIENKSKRTHSAIPILLFLIAKLLAYTLLGFGLGYLGSKLSLSIQVRIAMAAIAGLFMVGSALRILDIHPIFRYLTINPPKFMYKLVKNQSKSKDYFAPFVLGLLTIIIPCGTTQAMEVLAITSGNPVTGALIMGVFVVGTAPLFFALGYLTTKLSDIFHQYFLRVAAVFVTVLGLISIQSAFALSGHPVGVDLNQVFASKSDKPSLQANGNTSNVAIQNGVQVVTISVVPHVYSPAQTIVSSKMPVLLKMLTSPGYACTNTFTIPSLRIEQFLPANQETDINLGQQKPGNIYYVCSMGMYGGNITVQ